MRRRSFTLGRALRVLSLWAKRSLCDCGTSGRNLKKTFFGWGMGLDGCGLWLDRECLGERGAGGVGIPMWITVMVGCDV